MAATNEFTYPYNPSGVLDECKIIGEPHTITPGTSANYNWFIPFAAPFFGFSVVVKHVASGKTLIRGVDYNLGLEYHQFNTQVTLRPVYGAIVLIDTNLTGQFTIDYMTIGGQFAIDQNKALALLANAAIDPRTTQWDSVTDIPSQFPVTQHLHDVDNITDMQDVVEAIKALTAGLLNGGGKWFQALNEHLNDFNDPHHVMQMIPGGSGGTAIPKATQQQAIEGVDNDGYMTSLRTQQWGESKVLQPLAQHIADKNNPHETDANDVGLGQVKNVGMATTTDADGNTNLDHYASLEVAIHVAQLAIDAYTALYNQAQANQKEAETGTSTAKWMSPLRVAQYVAEGVGKALQAHIDATGNVHSLTAKDLDLDNVANYRPTVDADITNQANLDNTVTTPEIVAMIVQRALDAAGAGDGLTQQDLETYVTSRLGKVQNLPLADYSDLVNPVGDTAYMTPVDTKTIVDLFGGVQLSGVCLTAAQVTAYKAQSVYQESLIDIPGNQVWEYDGDSASWLVTAGVTVAERLVSGVVYFNPVTKVGYKCQTNDPAAFVTLFEPPRVTVSTNPPPADVSGFSDGHVWYQVS